MSLRPNAACCFCRGSRKASARCTDRDDPTLIMAASGSAISGPVTPAVLDGASAAISLITLSGCRCGVSGKT